MTNYVKPLWMLFWSVLLSGISGVFNGWIANLISLTGSILGIIAIVKLGKRNWRLQKVKAYMIAVFVITLVMIPVAFLGEAGAFLVIAAMIALIVLGILSSYHQLYGLADMADEAGEAAHADKLRQLFGLYIAVTIGSVVLGLIPGIGPVIMIVASVGLVVYRLVLYYRSIQIEQGYEFARIG